MTTEDFNFKQMHQRQDNLIREGIVEKINQFAEKYSQRALLAYGRHIPSSQDDRVITCLIEAATPTDKKTKVYLIKEEAICCCGCGAGHLQVVAYENLEHGRIKGLQARIEKGDSGIFKGKEYLFEIWTSRVGVGGETATPSGANVSGVPINYDSARNLINNLTNGAIDRLGRRR